MTKHVETMKITVFCALRKKNVWVLKGSVFPTKSECTIVFNLLTYDKKIKIPGKVNLIQIYLLEDYNSSKLSVFF